MTIEYNAFQNCSSLEELNFSRNTEPIEVNRILFCIPDSCKIIVPDHAYDDWCYALGQNYFQQIVKYNDYIKNKISSKKLTINV